MKNSKNIYDFDQNEIKKKLTSYFRNNKANINKFGNRVNQTFEAYVFADTISRYRKNNWNIEIINPTQKKGIKIFKLKFSTNGLPNNYSYARCEKGRQKCQIRHQLRIRTYADEDGSANLCCDIAVIEDMDLSGYTSFDAVENKYLKAFGEVKHMAAYAELISSFKGLVSELAPNSLDGKYKRNHVKPFLFVSGMIYRSAEGIIYTFKKRKYAFEIISYKLMRKNGV
ncbi:hypothetical protein [Leptospira sp. GIMC2001]|uniref:hypothetical protein n=1 Tax=Leptospira sp. GIMC2001 TaxID=1513297 RepID=UPI00234B6866|nr:hypothetical protein [Leptospira sp. GIMC2001]WCL50682.1 hypothetical protein O4O04_07690 [Leptospira sp. GIMC2001]